MAHDLTHRTTAELVAIVTAPGERPLLADAVGELVLRYKNLIYKQALTASGGDSSLAEDIFQETFLRLFTWLKHRHGEPLHSFARLLQVFSRRAAIDLMRKERRSPLPPPPPPPPADLDRLLYVQELLELLDDERSAAVVRLSYLEGLSAKEVAAKLKLSPGNVRVLRYRALEAIRAKSALDDYADEVEPL